MNMHGKNGNRDAPAWEGRTVSLRGVSFRAESKGGAPLSMQLAAAIQDAIVRRKLRPGDVLPTIHEWAAACGTGVKVPRHALERLAAGGWARPVRGVGFVVVHRSEDAGANDRILFYVRQTGFSYYCAGLMAVLEPVSASGARFLEAVYHNPPLASMVPADRYCGGGEWLLLQALYGYPVMTGLQPDGEKLRSIVNQL